MPRLQLVPFTDAHLDAAAELLAARHERHRASEPLLPVTGDARAHVERAWQVEGATGAFASRGRTPVGYVVGAPTAKGRMEVGLAGSAVAEVEAEAARDLYAAAAQVWHDHGLTHHTVYVPATDDAVVDAWFRLGFGLVFCFGVREVGDEPEWVSDVSVRAGAPRDIEVAALLERSLWEHQVLAPSFSGIEIPPLADFVDDWGGTWTDPRFAHVVAERDGRPVGHALLYVRPEGDLRIPPNAVDLAQMEVVPSERGTGVGRALWSHVLRLAGDGGYEVVTTDWRVVNLLASRFWPARGFRPTFLRLLRVL